MAVVYRYAFNPNVPKENVEVAIVLTIFALESLHGAAHARLDAGHYFNTDKHKLVIDADTPVGLDFNKLFLGFFQREHGPDAFRVERLTNPNTANREEQVS